MLRVNVPMQDYSNLGNLERDCEIKAEQWSKITIRVGCARRYFEGMIKSPLETQTFEIQ